MSILYVTSDWLFRLPSLTFTLRGIQCLCMKRDRWLRIRATSEDLEILKRGALLRGRRVSEHVRELLRKDEREARAELTLNRAATQHT